jgi:hypothetical protein
MSIFSSPPKVSRITEGLDPLREGVSHIGVWSLQRALNSIPDLGVHLSEDGAFGTGTRLGVTTYQKHAELTVDGIAGAATQRRLAITLRWDADPDMKVPRALVDSLVKGESGRIMAQVTRSIPGGVDCGYTQRRVTSPFSETFVKRAFDPPYQFRLLTDQLLGRYHNFLGYAYVQSRSDTHEYAWRLAALEHNWPYGASVLAKGSVLSTRSASWVPAGAKFEDGAPVVTYRDWAKFYAMGSHSHRHRGLVVKEAFGIPIDG